MVNIVFMHFPVFGPDSVTAAMASMCANEQGMFWGFHDHLYENQGIENSGWADSDAMKAFASDLDLDREKFDSCLDSKKYKEYVEGDLALALDLKFPGTPSFIVMRSDGSDAEGIVGAQPYASFKSVIDRKLA
jgi:protein-disulfide isomerase